MLLFATGSYGLKAVAGMRKLCADGVSSLDLRSGALAEAASFIKAQARNRSSPDKIASLWISSVVRADMTFS